MQKRTLSFIANGSNNSVTGNYSAILGGSGNSDGGYSYAAVFGQGITAVANNTFHVQCLNVINAPLFGAWPSGTLAYVNATPGMIAAGFPAGSKIAMII
jgi:hypothetical protein